MGFRLIPTSITLNDLEQRKHHHHYLFKTQRYKGNIYMYSTIV